MANSALQGKTYNIESEFQRFLGNNISYEALKMHKSRLLKSKQTQNLAEFKRLGGDEVLKYLEVLLKTDRDSIKNQKKIGKDTGRENQFIKTHTKDRDNANPTGIGGIPKMNKGSINRKLLDNKEVYNESIIKEINKIKYLIEYLIK